MEPNLCDPFRDRIYVALLGGGGFKELEYLYTLSFGTDIKRSI